MYRLPIIVKPKQMEENRNKWKGGEKKGYVPEKAENLLG